VVITVCDKAAGEACVFRAGGEGALGLEDPSDVNGDEASVQAAFDATLETIATRCRPSSHCLFPSSPVQLKLNWSVSLGCRLFDTRASHVCWAPFQSMSQLDELCNTPGWAITKSSTTCTGLTFARQP
jgi:hypothetical protein